MGSRPRLLLATNNAGKVAEFRELLGECGWETITPADVGLNIEIEETGRSYLENATIKATTCAKAGGMPALADDSGLEVDALDGRPGILSARYAGADRSDQERVAALLRELAGVPAERRTARFRCVIVIAAPDGRTQSAEGIAEGRIAFEARGENGFGYDPVFLPLDGGLTMAELPVAKKHEVSHRGAAAREARKLLEKMLHAV